MDSKVPLHLDICKQFKKDLKRCKKRGQDLAKLWFIVDRLQNGICLESKFNPHPLSSQYQRSWECHIEPDWLLIWDIECDILHLVRTGSHSDLF